MSYQGDIVEDGTFFFSFTSRKFSSGVPFLLAGSPVLSCYKDSDDTQTTNGITLVVDRDAVVGFNEVQMVLTDAFYVAGVDYVVVITTGTVDSVSVVGEVIATFSIENRSQQITTDAIIIGVAEAGTLSVTEMTTDLTEATDDHYIGRTVIWTTGPLAGQASNITDYLGSTGKLTYSTVTDVPVAADAFVIV